jgi:hypothetical protein
MGWEDGFGRAVQRVKLGTSFKPFIQTFDELMLLNIVLSWPTPTSIPHHTHNNTTLGLLCCRALLLPQQVCLSPPTSTQTASSQQQRRLMCCARSSLQRF